MGFKGKKIFSETPRSGRRGSDSGEKATSATPETATAETPAEATTPAAPVMSLSGGHVPSEGDLVKVRELLFGSQIQEQRDEIGRLESRLLERLSTATETMGKSLDTIEELVLGQMNNAIERVNAEGRDRKAADEAMAKRFDELSAQLETKVDEISERSRRVEHDLRDQLLSQCKLLSDTITQRHEDVVSLVNDGLGDLRSKKLDRSSVAALLVDFAARLDEGDSAKD